MTVELAWMLYRAAKGDVGCQEVADYVRRQELRACC
jgi:hypothetical protein